MRHPAILAVVGLLVMAAAPVGVSPGAAPSDALPVPPIPPDERPAADAAPVPNDDARGPAEPLPSSIRIAPSLNQQGKVYSQGEGYTPGSSYNAYKDGERDRLLKPSPGFNLRMSLP